MNNSCIRVVSLHLEACGEFRLVFLVVGIATKFNYIARGDDYIHPDDRFFFFGTKGLRRM